MNLPNYITLFRIIISPIIILLTINYYPYNDLYYNFIFYKFKIINYNYYLTYKLTLYNLIAGILFLISIFSDWLDGYIAKKINKITLLGKFLDPIADKILINSILIIFAYKNIIPILICIILIIRDFIIDFIRQILANKKIIMSAHKLAKYKTTFEMFGILLLFFLNHKIFKIFFKKNNKLNQYNIINQIIMIPTYIGAILSIITAVNYIYLYYKQIFNIQK